MFHNNVLKFSHWPLEVVKVRGELEDLNVTFVMQVFFQAYQFMNERRHFNEMIVMQVFLKKEILMNILNEFMKDIQMEFL